MQPPLLEKTTQSVRSSRIRIGGDMGVSRNGDVGIGYVDCSSAPHHPLLVIRLV